MRDELPEGWANAKLEDLTSFVRGVAYNKSQAREAPGPGLVLVLRAGNLQGGRIQTDSDLVYVPASCVSDAQRLRVGDNVVAMSSGSASVVGKAATVCAPMRDTSFGAFCGLFRPQAPDVTRWAATFFQSAGYLSQVRESSAGVNINNLRSSNVLDFRLPLPPLNEQRRIVAKIEALTARSRRAKEALDAIPPLLDKLRQSILAAAFRGDLTATWRAQHPNVEPATELLKRIRTERRHRWEQAELAKLKAKGKVPGDDRWKEKYEEPAEDLSWIVSEPPSVPVVSGYVDAPALNGWTWVRLLDVARLESGHTPRKSVPEYWKHGDVPWICLQDIRAAHGLVIQDTKYKPTMVGIENSAARLLPAGTVVFSRDISVGFATVMGRSMATTQHFANWVCGGFLRPKFLMFALMASRDALIRGGEGTTVKTIYFPALERFSVLLPPLAEQDAIVDRVQEALSRVDRMRARMRGDASSLEALDSAILAKAFRGELVPQDPNDEPASVLLERIRAEKTDQPRKKGQKKKR